MGVSNRLRELFSLHLVQTLRCRNLTQLVSNRLRELFSLHPHIFQFGLRWKTPGFQTAYANYFHCTLLRRRCLQRCVQSFKPLTRIIFTALIPVQQTQGENKKVSNRLRELFSLHERLCWFVVCTW